MISYAPLTLYVVRPVVRAFTQRADPRWPPKVVKILSFTLYRGYSCSTLRVKNSLKIALSLMVSEIFTIFYFPLKIKMAAISIEK